MDRSGNPLLLTLFFLARCVVPLVIMLGLSYLLKRLGLITEPPPPPEERPNGENGPRHNSGEGGLTHGTA